MNRIRLLPEQVANQIAAGEVIERPASVVKELVENSLDAQAARVTVEIQAGGRSLVRVTDDGLGMSRDDALLSLERHATSKIRRAEDLAAITTLGFRGEALPSIASVSRFTLTTRERDNPSPEGTQVLIGGGKILQVKAAGTAPGTTVEVRQIFFNLPARRKFLRTEETESAHIQHYLALAALASPEVALTFQKDGRLVWQLPAVRSGIDIPARLTALRERLRALYGAEQGLLPVNFCADLPTLQDSEDPGAQVLSQPSSPATAEKSEESGSPPAASPAPPSPGRFRLWGFLGAPGVSRATREDQHLFVNRRPVENRGLNFALLEGYHTALMKGRYPVCCLFLEIDPSAVDVNIHPSKREVRFHREADVRRLVAQAVRQTLLAFAERAGQRAEGRGQQRELASGPGTGTEVGRQKAEVGSQRAEVRGQQPEREGSEPPYVGSYRQRAEGGGQESGAAAGTGPAREAARQAPIAPPAQAGPVPLLNVPLRLVGVIGRLYVVLESDRGLVLLDQHAAHERILFEQMLERLEHQEQAPSQKLLLPETVEVSARDASFLRGHLAALTRLGVGLSEFGECTFLLDALPPFVKTAEPRRFVLELVDELKATGQEINSLRLGEHTVAKTVCRHAVKANDPLAGPELERLVEDLRRCAMPYTCPHGRPTLIEMNFRELEKKFGRAA
jgi:DNA mismatch repair protein MutL